MDTLPVSGAAPKNVFRAVLSLAAPVALAHLANMAMQLVDTFFIGRLGAAAIGGGAIGNSVFASLMILGIGLLLGLDFLVAHAFGAKRFEECHRHLVQALYLAAGISFPFIVLMHIGSYFLDGFGVTPEVVAQAAPYLRASSWSLLPVLLFTAVRQYLQAMGVALPVLIILLLGNLVNALCNWLFIFGNFGFPEMGIAGSGIATTVARTTMFLFLLAYFVWRDRRLNLGFSRIPMRFSWPDARKLAGLGLPAGLQMLFEVGVFATATILVGRLGAIPLAAHHVVLMIASFTFMVPLGLSAAGAVRVGQALGENSVGLAVKSGWTTIQMGALFMGISGLSLYLVGEPLLGIFTADATVIGLGRKLLLIAAFFQLSDGIQVSATGVLRGVGNTRASMFANLIGHWGLGLPAGMLLCFSFGWGAPGIWIGLSIGLTIVAAALVLAWRSRSRALVHSVRG